MESKLEPLAQKLLVAIHNAGAKPGEPFTTDLTSLVQRTGAVSADKEACTAALRNLVRGGVSVKRGGMSYTGPFLSSVEIGEDDDTVIVTIGVPLAAIPPADIGR